MSTRDRVPRDEVQVPGVWGDRPDALPAACSGNGTRGSVQVRWGHRVFPLSPSTSAPASPTQEEAVRPERRQVSLTPGGSTPTAWPNGNSELREEKSGEV